MGELRSETDVLAALAAQAMGGERLRLGQPALARHLREAIAAVVPGYAAMGRIETDGEFQVAGRTFHEPRFATPDGKAHFHVVEVPAPVAGLQLMTIRSEGQFNTVVYDDGGSVPGQHLP